MCVIRPPQNDDEFAAYYHFRWRMLRAPWGEPEGSEQDALEGDSFHLIAVNRQHRIIGCARLQANSPEEAQLRYMAVADDYQRRGIGRKLLAAMENRARQNGASRLVLDAREGARGFYERLGYRCEGKSYLLFGEIQHYRMHKRLRQKNQPFCGDTH